MILKTYSFSLYTRAGLMREYQGKSANHNYQATKGKDSRAMAHHLSFSAAYILFITKIFKALLSFRQ